MERARARRNRATNTSEAAFPSDTRWIVALAGTVSIDAKRRRLLGSAWEPFAGQTSILPFAAIATGRNRFIPREIGFWRWAVGLLAYALMLGGHGPAIGVSPFPV